MIHLLLFVFIVAFIVVAIQVILAMARADRNTVATLRRGAQSDAPEDTGGTLSGGIPTIFSAGSADGTSGSPLADECVLLSAVVPAPGKGAPPRPSAAEAAAFGTPGDVVRPALAAHPRLPPLPTRAPDLALDGLPAIAPLPARSPTAISRGTAILPQPHHARTDRRSSAWH